MRPAPRKLYVIRMIGGIDGCSVARWESFGWRIVKATRVLRGGVCSFHGRDEIEARKRMIEQNLKENERHAARIAVLEGRGEP